MDQPDDEAVARFMAATGSSAQQAEFFLEASGSYAAAVQMYYDSQPGASHAANNAPARAPAAGVLPPRPRAPVAPAAAAAAQNARRGPFRGLVRSVLGLPFAVIKTGIGIISTVLHAGVTLAAFVGDRVLPGRVMHTARGMAAALASAEDQPPEAQAAAFAEAFAAQYGQVHPRFVASSWRQATAQAHAEFKFLLVYVHSAEHEDTDSFCREVLCSPDVVEYVNNTFVSWGGDVRKADAFGLASRLNVSTYPFLALLAYSGSRTKLVMAVQGKVAKEQLLAAMARAVEDQGALLVAERVERQELETSRRLLDEQNAEYEAALAADRERDARREQERKSEQDRQRVLDEQAAAEQAAADAEAAKKAEAEASIRRRRVSKGASLAPEPAAGSPAAALRVRLPDGSNHQRSFALDATIEQVYDWVDSLESVAFHKYSLVCAFPRRVYGSDSRGLTLEQAGLAPQGALFVQGEDD